MKFNCRDVGGLTVRVELRSLKFTGKRCIGLGKLPRNHITRPTTRHRIQFAYQIAVQKLSLAGIGLYFHVSIIKA